jgi:hypothetical protein
MEIPGCNRDLAGAKIRRVKVSAVAMALTGRRSQFEMGSFRAPNRTRLAVQMTREAREFIAVGLPEWARGASTFMDEYNPHNAIEFAQGLIHEQSS